MIDSGFIGKGISALFGGNGNTRKREKTNLDKAEEVSVFAAAVIGAAALVGKGINFLITVYREKNNPEVRDNGGRPDFHRESRRVGNRKF